MFCKLRSSALILFGVLLLLSSCKSNSSKSVVSKKDSTLHYVPRPSDSSNTNVSDTSKNKLLAKEIKNTNQDAINYAVLQNTKDILWLKAAMGRAVNKNLRSDAAIMLTDHEQMDAEMKKIIVKKKYVIPTIDTLNEVNINDKIGIDWDKAWVGKMMSDHLDLIKMFTKAEKDVTDPELKSFITNSKAEVQTHMDMILKLNKKIK